MRKRSDSVKIVDTRFFANSSLWIVKFFEFKISQMRIAPVKTKLVLWIIQLARLSLLSALGVKMSQVKMNVNAYFLT